MLVIEITEQTGCGSVTVYDVNFDTEEAEQKLRFPWNEAHLHGYTSKSAACFAARNIDAEVGTVPPHFKIL